MPIPFNEWVPSREISSPNWNTKDIYKTLIPITIGYELNK